MNESNRESGEAPEGVGEQTAARVHSSQDDLDGGKQDGPVAATYDELDYRLMATFPASDAVAQY